MGKLLNRDDVPYEVAQEIVANIQEENPGYTVVFAGDVPENELPEGLLEAAKHIEEMFRRSREEGRCIDCDRQIDGWPGSVIDAKNKTFAFPKGWRFFTLSGQEEIGIAGFQCPECDALEEAEHARESGRGAEGCDAGGDVHPEGEASGPELCCGD